MGDPQWVQFSTHSFKRKRAELACTLCHSKKIRCDLQAKSLQGHNSCTNCLSSGKDCQLRPSKREKSRRSVGIEVSHPPTPPIDNPVLDRTRLSSLSFDLSRNGLDSNNHNLGSHAGESSPHDQVPIELLDPNADTAYQPQRSAHNSHGAPLSKSPRESPNDRGPALSNRWSENLMSSSSGRSDRPLYDHGVFQVNGPDNIDPTRYQAVWERKEPNDIDTSQPDLRQSFTETYFEYCYTWCPVLNISTLFEELAESPLLDNALGIVGSHVRPPMLPQPGPAAYYDRARRRFYDDEEENLITSLQAVSLFYWWAPRPPSVMNKHSSWWWTAVVIKHAQQAGFHQESPVEISAANIGRCLRRRIWWTAFARERLTAICQGKPCMIDPTDCNVPEPSLADFPDLEDKSKAEVFIYWVRLCAIIGRLAKELSRSASSSSTARAFPVNLGKELIEWIRSLPPHLQLTIGSSHTPKFNLDVHQLHLPYLAIIVVLYLTRSSQPLPQAFPPATLAASCIARILKDILMRSATRFLMPITCWYTGMAFIALLQASRTEHLKNGANADLEILILAIKQLKNMWATATVFEQQFDRLRANSGPLTPQDFPNSHLGNDRSTRALNSEEEVLQSGIDWLDYFPFVTSQTSSVAEKLLAQQNLDPVSFDNLSETYMFHYQAFIEGFDNWADCTVFL